MRDAKITAALKHKKISKNNATDERIARKSTKSNVAHSSAETQRNSFMNRKVDDGNGSFYHALSTSVCFSNVIAVVIVFSAKLKVLGGIDMCVYRKKRLHDTITYTFGIYNIYSSVLFIIGAHNANCKCIVLTSVWCTKWISWCYIECMVSLSAIYTYIRA